MSTIDPASRRAGASSRGVGSIIGVVVLAGFWWLFGLGIGDAVRYPIGTLYLDASAVPPNTDPALLWALFCGVLGGAVVGAGLQNALARRVGLRMAMGIVTAVALAAIALGVLLGAARSWVKPDAIGSAGGEPWNAGSWLAWSSQYWVPAVLLLIGVAILLAEFRARRTRAERKARADEIVRHGTATDGVVTETHDTGIRINNQPRVLFTVRFTDHRGITRWVTKTQTIEWTDLPRVGDTVVVHYDTARPADEDSILVSRTQQA
ncbi:hypothetical protein ACFVWR_08225 [Leifsonia sp. NPDC058292]|uniref:hypothetical protein n=1 Tax=Leifsonia sp. NPDC058292 TaxID=3346428 RepID=UPI0036D80622